MKFNEHEPVRLLVDRPDEGLSKGDVGVVVIAFSVPYEAYEVEFLNTDGSFKAMLTLRLENICKF